MMRVTIIPDDGFVSVDGEGFTDLDLSFMPADIHAVQWYHTEGEVEYRDERGRATYNELVVELTLYEPALSAWRLAKEKAADLVELSESEEPPPAF